MEIERKFLIKELPSIEPVKHVKICSGYISVEPEVRIRSYEVISGEEEGHVDYLLTIKGNGDLVREEIETYVSKEFFEQVKDFIGKPFIEKDFRKYYVDGHVIECSIVDNGHFMYSEVEFNTEEEAKAFKYPFGEAEDVTYDKFYKMKNYWSRTR